MYFECRICWYEYDIPWKKDIQDTTTCPECWEEQEIVENSR